MELLTLLAMGATIILTGALTRVGELSLDGAIAELKNLIAAKSPDALKRLQGADQNAAVSSETIESIATLIGCNLWLINYCKESLHELLLQERETLTDLIYEVMEDIALAKAIEEGLDDENVSSEEVFALLSE